MIVLSQRERGGSETFPGRSRLRIEFEQGGALEFAGQKAGGLPPLPANASATTACSSMDMQTTLAVAPQ